MDGSKVRGVDVLVVNISVYVWHGKLLFRSAVRF